MFENFIGFLKKIGKKDGQIENKTNKDEAKERLHLVLMQDRANVSADFLDMMRQEIIDVIKKYIDVDEGDIDVRLTNKQNSDGTTGAPALYANIPIKSIKNENKKEVSEDKEQVEKTSETKEENNENENKEEKEENNNIDEEIVVEEKEEIIEKENEEVEENSLENEESKQDNQNTKAKKLNKKK